MDNPKFLPLAFETNDEFFAERVDLVLNRTVPCLIIAMICSLVMAAVVFLKEMMSGWQLILVTVLFLLDYPYTLKFIQREKRKKRYTLTDQRAVLDRITLRLLLVVISWVFIVAMMIPSISGDTRLVVVTLFMVVTFCHFVPLTCFPKRSFVLATTNLLPTSFLLLLNGDATINGLGLAGMVLAFTHVLTVAWLFRLDISNLHLEHKQEVVTEPDMSEQGMQGHMIARLYDQKAQSIFAQDTLAFLLVILFRTPDNEALLWCWFLAFVSVQTWRAAGALDFYGNPDKRTVSQWRLRYGAGLVVSQLCWFCLYLIFYEAFNNGSMGIFVGVLMLVVALSSFGLTIDRLLFHFNSLLCSLLPFFILLTAFNSWMVIALGTLSAATVYLVVENIHSSSVRALKSELLKQLAEYRAGRMQELNIDLNVARQRLAEVNASLETQVQERTRELDHQANHDMLTGMGNRYYFAKEVEAALAEYQQHQKGFAVYMLDLDRFKEINDGLGHIAGDHVLRVSAQRIQQVCGEVRVCARWGGDEFVILQPMDAMVASIFSFCEELLEQLQQPIELSSGPVIIGASVGVSLCPAHGVTSDALLEHADIAVFRAKTLRSGRTIYNEHWGREAAKRVQLAQALRIAIDTPAIDVAFQPLISAQSGKLIGFEALSRWTQVDGKAVSPGEFIPVAEESGLMPRLGNWVLQCACSRLMKLAPESDLTVAVNISPAQFQDPDFASDVFSLLKSYNMSPSRLEIEITESLFAQDVERVRGVINKLRDRGIRVSIDDFGTGYSSISYLKDFPLDTLKIDRSFVTALTDGGEGIYGSIVALARGLDLSIVVEGVETKQELEAVLRLGGDVLQGFYFSKPLRQAELVDWLHQFSELSFELDVTGQARLI